MPHVSQIFLTLHFTKNKAQHKCRVERHVRDVTPCVAPTAHKSIIHLHIRTFAHSHISEAIGFAHLTTGYGHTIVSRNLTATLLPGVTALVAPNGKGKSTLLRTLAALQPPLSGTICYGARPIAALTPAERARHVAVVLTAHPAPPSLTAREAVSMGRIPHSSLLRPYSAADRRAVTKALAQAGAEPFADRPVNTLSDGQRQRVYLAKALAQETPVIFLDEPTAYLDPAASAEALRLLSRLAREQGKAILLTTHDITGALLHADRLWMLRTDTILEGTPTQLLRSGALDDILRQQGATVNKDRLTLTYSLQEEMCKCANVQMCK